MHDLWGLVTGGMTSWYRTKMFIEHALVINSDAIHVLVGVFIQLILAALARRSVATWLPWLGVLGLAVANEAVDLWIEQWPYPAMQYGESAKDILLTIALPTILLVAVRLRPNLFRPASRR